MSRDLRSDLQRVVLAPLSENESLSTSEWMSRPKVAACKIASACCSEVTQTPKGRLFWTVRLTVKVLLRMAPCSVCEGLSPNALRYSTEKRPNSRKPKRVAISVTVTCLQSAAKRARLASDSRFLRRCRHGGAPWIL